MIINWNDYREVERLKIKDLTKEQIFTFDYPFYKDDKSEFEQKFMLHFRYESIGYDTLDEFKDHLRDILTYEYPKYKHYYQTSLKAKDLKWWNNKDYEFTQERKLVTESTGSSNTKSENTGYSESHSYGTDSTTSVNKFSDTPEGTIDNIDRYMTTANQDKSDNTSQSNDEGSSNSTGDSTTKSNNNGNETETIKTIEGGNIGVTTSADLITSWLKDGFIDLDRIMLKDCEQLFQLVY